MKERKCKHQWEIVDLKQQSISQGGKLYVVCFCKRCTTGSAFEVEFPHIAAVPVAPMQISETDLAALQALIKKRGAGK